MPVAFLRLNSKDRDLNQSNTRSDFVVEVKESVSTQQVKAVQVVSAQVPNVFYNVNDTNNTIKITQDGETQATLTLTNGQYTITTFMTMAKTIIDAGLAGGSTVAITQNANTQLLTLAFSGGTNPNSALDVDDDSRAGWCVFGFSASSAEAASHTATSIPNLRGYSAVYIHSKEINPGGFFDGNSGAVSAFCEVSFHDVAFSAMGYYKSTNSRSDLIEYTVARNMSRVRLVVRDSEGNKLDTGCSDVSVLLKIWY